MWKPTISGQTKHTAGYSKWYKETILQSTSKRYCTILYVFHGNLISRDCMTASLFKTWDPPFCLRKEAFIFWKVWSDMTMYFVSTLYSRIARVVSSRPAYKLAVVCLTLACNILGVQKNNIFLLILFLFSIRSNTLEINTKLYVCRLKVQD